MTPLPRPLGPALHGGENWTGRYKYFRSSCLSASQASDICDHSSVHWAWTADHLLPSVRARSSDTSAAVWVPALQDYPWSPSLATTHRTDRPRPVSLSRPATDWSCAAPSLHNPQRWGVPTDYLPTQFPPPRPFGHHSARRRTERLCLSSPTFVPATVSPTPTIPASPGSSPSPSPALL